MKTVLAFSFMCVASVALADNPATPTRPAAQPVAAPPAAPTCFELSADGKIWSKTPELLCVGSGSKAVEITMKTGMPPSPTQVAVFHLDLKTRARCIDCNKDVFALTNPENSIFNQLAITFDGKRDVKAGTESGTVSIGKTQLHYRRVK